MSNIAFILSLHLIASCLAPVHTNVSQMKDGMDTTAALVVVNDDLEQNLKRYVEEGAAYGVCFDESTSFVIQISRPGKRTLITVTMVGRMIHRGPDEIGGLIIEGHAFYVVGHKDERLIMEAGEDISLPFVQDSESLIIDGYFYDERRPFRVFYLDNDSLHEIMRQECLLQ